mgnify:CR=1 FL=1
MLSMQDCFELPKTRKVGESLKKQVAAGQKWTCKHCNKMLKATYQVDHRIPHCISFDDSPSNLEALCVQCHATKTQLEQPRIHLYRQQKAFILENDILHQRPCWECHRLISDFFDHDCPKDGAAHLYSSTNNIYFGQLV